MSLAMNRWLLPIFCLVASLEAQVAIPQVGSVRCPDGSLRAVFGVPASFVLGRPIMQPVDAVSFSGDGGLVSAKGRIQLFGRSGSPVSEFETGDLAALVNIDGGLQTAIAWLPASHSILYWDGTLFLRTDVPDEIRGTVTSIRRDAENARLLVLEDKAVVELTIALTSGNTVSALPLSGIEGPAFPEGESIVFQDRDGLEIEGPNGVRRTVPLAATDLRIERMGTQWLHLSSAASRQHWALHVTPKSVDLSQLPAATASEGAK